MVKYQTEFLKNQKAFNFDLVEFCDNSFVGKKLYPSDCTVNSLNKRQVIFITHNKNTFLANNGQYQAWYIFSA